MTASQDILSQETTLLCLSDGGFQAFYCQSIFCSNIDEAFVRSNSERSNDHALKNGMGIALKNRPVHEGTRIAEILDKEVVLIDRNLQRKTIAYDHIVTCWTRPNTDFLNQLKKAGLPAINVGDSVRPRNLHAAVKEGASAGIQIDRYNFFNPNNALTGDVPLDIAGQLTR